MIRANTGTIVRFSYKGKIYRRELHEFCEIGHDFWTGDLGYLDENEPVPETSFLIHGHTSNGVPVWHDLDIQVDSDATEIITEGIFIEL